MNETIRSTSSPERIVIHDVRVLDPQSRLDAVSDVVIERGVIERVTPSGSEAREGSDETKHIEGKSRWLVPAFVDLRSHFGEPGYEYKEDIASGLRAAAAGGYAHVCVMPDTNPVNDRRSITEAMVARAKEVGGPTLHPVGAITLGRQGKELTEMADLLDAGIVAVSDGNRSIQSSAVMRRALEYAANFNLPVLHHADDRSLSEGSQMHEGNLSTRLGLRGSPREAESIIVARDLMLARATNARYHAAHISTEKSVALIREAKSEGLAVSAEVTPHHLLLTCDAVGQYDTSAKVTPPLREERDRAALLEGLADGTIDAVATDHHPQSSIEKDCEFQAAACGAAGLEWTLGSLLHLVSEGTLSAARLFDALSSAPASIVGLTAPSIQPGVTAEVCLIDPEASYTLGEHPPQSKGRNSPLLGRPGQGRILLTIANGQIAYDQLD